jgi:hypothetical protein
MDYNFKTREVVKKSVREDNSFLGSQALPPCEGRKERKFS